MAEFPALPLWTDAYLGDTTHLTTIEHGAYLLLLFTAWRTPTYDLPDDDRLLARYCRMTDGQWARIRPTIMAYWKLRDGRWFNGRLLDERDAVRRKVAQRSDAGKASALKRLNRAPAPVERNADEISTSKATPTPISKISSKKDISGFAEFYSAFPKHVGRGAAVKAYASALGRSTADAILAGAKRLAEAKAGTDKQFIQNPATWLNADGWLDEIYPTTGGTNGRVPRKSNHETFYDAASAVAARIASRGNGQAGGPEQATILLLPTRADKTPD